MQRPQNSAIVAVRCGEVRSLFAECWLLNTTSQLAVWLWWAKRVKAKLYTPWAQASTLPPHLRSLPHAIKAMRPRTPLTISALSKKSARTASAAVAMLAGGARRVSSSGVELSAGGARRRVLHFFSPSP
jgi:hypothetical protein